MSLNIILMGAPGVGKGTQAATMAKELNIPHISTGDLFRAISKQSTPLAEKIKLIISSGAFVSDELTNELVADRLSKDDVKEGFILDGYPRTTAQAEFLSKHLQSKQTDIDYVLCLDAPEKVVLARLGGRRVCPQCGATFHITLNKPKKDGICDNCQHDLIIRKDDNLDVIKNRLDIYNSSTTPILNYYAEHGKLTTIDASDEQQVVLQRILATVRK